jgi:hypothetical protein
MPNIAVCHWCHASLGSDHAKWPWCQTPGCGHAVDRSPLMLILDMQSTLPNYYYALARLSRSGITEEAGAACAAGRRVLTGMNKMGLRWAACGGRRVLAYAEGGYSVQEWVDGVGWCLPYEEARADDLAWAPLLAALGL